LGAWNSATEYLVYDSVEYLGVLYVSIKTPNKNHTPAAGSEYWLSPGGVGPQGPPGEKGSPGTLTEESVETKHLKNLAVTEAKIAEEAVATGKIKNSAVTQAKLAGEAVTEGVLAAGAVSETKLGAEAVATGRIKNLAVTEGKIAAGAVTEAKLGSEAVSEAKLGSEAVSEAKIKALAVTEGKLAATLRATIVRSNATLSRFYQGISSSEGVLQGGANGVTVEKTGTGLYTVKFATEFKNAPSVNVTTTTSNTFFQITEVTTKEVKLVSKSVGTTPAATNAGFHIQVYGTTVT
jgi:hypothetical protein